MVSPSGRVGPLLWIGISLDACGVCCFCVSCFVVFERLGRPSAIQYVVYQPSQGDLACYLTYQADIRKHAMASPVRLVHRVHESPAATRPISLAINYLGMDPASMENGAAHVADNPI